MAGEGFLVLSTCEQTDVGDVERHLHNQSGGETERLKWKFIANSADRCHCSGKVGGGGNRGGKQVVNTWKGGGLLVVYSRNITTTQSQRGSYVTRGGSCRYLLCVNNGELCNKWRACKCAVCCVYRAMNLISYRICEFIIYIILDKVLRLTLYVRIVQWEQCDGSKYFHRVIGAVLVNIL
jgi:hypothetical protein